MKLHGKPKEKKKKKTTCLERSQLKMLFDVIRGKRECNAATEFIGGIDAEFDATKKKKKKVKEKVKEAGKSWIEEWL